MFGTLIVNHFLNGSKYTSQTELYLSAASSLDMDLTVRTNAEPIPRESDFVLFLDKDTVLARSLELQGMKVFNSACSIALCDDKALTWLKLSGSNIPMPKTLPVPLTFFSSDWTGNPFLQTAKEFLGYPMVAKARCGSFGKQVWLIEDENALIERLNTDAPGGMILQEFIATSAGRDIRINVVGGKPVACMYRYSNTDFRANISAGGSMKPYTPTSHQIAMAVDACDALGLDFGGVDILFGEQDDPVLCEVNSNAHIRSILDCTGICVADTILQHICKTVRGGS